MSVSVVPSKLIPKRNSFCRSSKLIHLSDFPNSHKTAQLNLCCRTIVCLFIILFAFGLKIKNIETHAFNIYDIQLSLSYSTFLFIHSGEGGGDEPWRFTPLHGLAIAGAFIGVGFIVWGLMSLRKWISQKAKVPRSTREQNYRDPEMLGQIAVML